MFPKETVQLLFWFDQYLFIDNAISRVHDGRYHTFRLNLACTSWWWQFSCSEECTPDSITGLGWDVNTKSMQGDEFDKTWVGSWINSFTPNWDVIASILEPSWAVLSCLYQFDDLALKSPRKTIKKEFLLAIVSKFSSRLSANV